MKNELNQLSDVHGMKAFGLLPSNVEMIRVNSLDKRLQPKVPFPHKHNFFQLVIVTGGQGWHEIDFQRHSVHSGAIFILKPGQVHDWELSSDTTGFLVEFEFNAIKKAAAFHDPLSQLYSLPDVLKLNGSRLENILRHCQEMLREQEEKDAHWETILQLRLVTLTVLMLRAAPIPADAVTGNKVIHEFYNLVHSHYSRHHGVEFYAEKLKLTPKALTMRVTRACGVPPKKIIQDRCILEAKRLLAYSAICNAAIAKKIGFEDPNYFVRLFRSKTGLTPHEFREQQKGEPQLILDEFPKA